MPTRNRKDFALQSIKYFHRQTYPNRELIILDDGKADLTEYVAGDPLIRYFRFPTTLTIGAKRNHGCALASGEIVAQWDDDDWYGSSRLSSQIEPLLADVADVSGFADCTFFDLESWKFWRCSADIFNRMFIGNVHSGTLVFKRNLFETGLRYPIQSLAEDAHFLYHCNRKSARVRRVRSDGAFIYLRHPYSTWQFECGRHIDPQQWTCVGLPEIPAEDIEFFSTANGQLARGK